MNGNLYIVATPIGNMGDLTLRAVETLQMVDMVYAEDTRVTGRLLQRYAVSKPQHSYREALGGSALQRVIEKLIAELAAGKNVAYVSDAGTPGISDPGNFLVSKVAAAGFRVIPIPGSSSLTALLSVAGFPAQRPLFVGFLPKKKGHETLMKKLHEALVSEVCDVIVIFESPERIRKLLEELLQWKVSLEVCLGRELTKLYEEVLRGEVQEVAAELASRKQIKGEIVLAVQLMKKK